VTETLRTVGPTTLNASSIRVHFAGVKAVDDIHLALGEGEILGLIGPNGAGKTTLVNVLTGFQSPTAGRVTLGGSDVTGWKPERLADAGLARTFQSIRLFEALTVFENVQVAALGAGRAQRDARDATHGLLKRLALGDSAEMQAGALSHGAARRVGIARAMAMHPRFLLLDEPAAGLNEDESAELVETLKAIRRDFNVGLLVIEHDMQLIMSLCERIQVLDHGKTIALGTAAEVRRNPAVLAAYLGSGRERDAQH
jgi:ABC-type branched-subunit amino acid transport system ATPase component